MAVTLALNGSYSFSTRKRANTLPALPAAANNTWGLTTNRLGINTGFGDSSNTVILVDTARNSFFRNAIVNFGTGITRPETLTINSPHDGYNTRRSETATGSDGSTSTVSEFLALDLRATGLTAVAFLADSQFTVVVVKP